MANERGSTLAVQPDVDTAALERLSERTKAIIQYAHHVWKDECTFTFFELDRGVSATGEIPQPPAERTEAARQWLKRWAFDHRYNWPNDDPSGRTFDGADVLEIVAALLDKEPKG